MRPSGSASASQVAVSAEHGEGIGDLVDDILAALGLGEASTGHGDEEGNEAAPGRTGRFGSPSWADPTPASRRSSTPSARSA